MLLFDDIAAEYRDFAAYADGDSATFAGWAFDTGSYMAKSAGSCCGVCVVL